MKDGGFGSGAMTWVIIAIVVTAAVVGGFIGMGYLSSSNKNSSGSAGNSGESGANNTTHVIHSWSIYLSDDGKNYALTKIIKAKPLDNGLAQWSGYVKIQVFGKNNTPLSGVNVTLDGCGIKESGRTNSSGIAVFKLQNVTLPSGSAQDEIKVRMEYHGEKKFDMLTVIRGSGEDREIGSWVIYVGNSNGGFNLTKVIKAHTTSTGEAVWSGKIKIVVKDQNDNPLADVKVVLNGCGVNESGYTNSSGTVIIMLQNVTLPSGVQQDQIEVKMIYEGLEKSDSLTVIRG